MSEPLIKKVFSRSGMFSLLVLSLISLYCSGCSPRHIIPPNQPDYGSKHADFSDVELFLTKFNVINKSNKDNDRDVYLLRSGFISYIEAQNKFKRVYDSEQTIRMPESNRYLLLEINIDPSYSKWRTWLLDLPFFYPALGIWPLTPMWGTAKVSVSARLIGADEQVIDATSMDEEDGYFVLFYSWYRPGIIEDALQTCYENVFKKLSKKLSENRNAIIAYIDNLPVQYPARKSDQLVFVKNDQASSIAILELDGIGIAEPDAFALSNRLITEVFKTGYFNVLEREKMNEILKEQGFQMSGCTSSECMVQAGKLLNVQQILGGSVSKVGGYYSVELRLIDVESGQILKVSNEDVQGNIEDVLIQGLKQAVYKLIQ
ncbi:MAG: hypothetical protein JXR46_12065 [Calditrichaceae bacterium]|nr:hypothetical protein [Calditrichaceae bacterium]MBN2709771.1 hypothetical protein [Calditrichaceae bacterium]RQV94965.1 MAG: hypothetical protein EH224_08815 [Calditrichota bacterium]